MLITFYRRKNRGSERLGNLPKATELKNGGSKKKSSSCIMQVCLVHLQHFLPCFDSVVSRKQ